MSDDPKDRHDRPDAGVVSADGDEAACAERQPLPPALAGGPPDGKTPARWAYERLVFYIRRFEERLDADDEVAMGFAGSDAGTLRIRGMGYFAPDLVTFYGLDQDGRKTQLVQHVTQLNVMLKAVPKTSEKAERIGFALESRLAGGADDTDGPDGPGNAAAAPS